MESRPPRPQDAPEFPQSIGDRRRAGWAEAKSATHVLEPVARETAATVTTLPDAVIWPEDSAAPGYRVFPERQDDDASAWERLWTLFVDFSRLPARFMAVGLLAYVFAFNFSVVRGSSMAPGIHDGDRILIDQLSYMFTEVERGDIVVLQYPLDPKLDYIKRVVGLPGDEILMVMGQLWINGERYEEDYLLEADPFTRIQETVSPGHYFVLGDNRLHSSDSREFGQVREELVRGKVDLRLWPPSRVGRVR